MSVRYVVQLLHDPDRPSAYWAQVPLSEDSYPSPEGAWSALDDALGDGYSRDHLRVAVLAPLGDQGWHALVDDDRGQRLYDDAMNPWLSEQAERFAREVGGS